MEININERITNQILYFLGELLGGHVRAVFTLITIIFIVCVSYTITSFREMPLNILEAKGNMDASPEEGISNNSFENEEDNIGMKTEKNYGSVENGNQTNQNVGKGINVIISKFVKIGKTQLKL